MVGCGLSVQLDRPGAWAIRIRSSVPPLKRGEATDGWMDAGAGEAKRVIAMNGANALSTGPPGILFGPRRPTAQHAITRVMGVPPVALWTRQQLRAMPSIAVHRESE